DRGRVAARPETRRAAPDHVVDRAPGRPRSVLDRVGGDPVGAADRRAGLRARPAIRHLRAARVGGDPRLDRRVDRDLVGLHGAAAPGGTVAPRLDLPAQPWLTADQAEN